MPSVTLSKQAVPLDLRLLAELGYDVWALGFGHDGRPLTAVITPTGNAAYWVGVEEADGTVRRAATPVRKLGMALLYLLLLGWVTDPDAAVWGPDGDQTTAGGRG